MTVLKFCLIDKLIVLRKLLKSKKSQHHVKIAPTTLNDPTQRKNGPTQQLTPKMAKMAQIVENDPTTQITPKMAKIMLKWPKIVKKAFLDIIENYCMRYFD